MTDQPDPAKGSSPAGTTAAPAVRNQGSMLRGWIVHVLIGVVAFDLLTLWLPLVRGVADGSSYEWGTYGFEGRGASGQYVGVVALAVLALTIIVLGWRTRSRAFRWLILLWQLPSGVLGVAAAAAGELQVEGESLGIDVTVPVPVLLSLYVAPAVLALYWCASDRTAERGPPPRWRRINSALLTIAIAVLPVQVALLRSGDPGSTTDAVGVILTIAQWIAVVAALAPWDTKQPVDLSRSGPSR